MVTVLKEVDAVVVGMGWTGSILARELTKAGMNVIRLERGLIGVQRNLGVDHQLLLPRHIDDRIGPQPAFISIH